MSSRAKNDRTTRVRLADLALWPTMLFIYALCALQLGGLDDMVVRQFFDPARGAFPLKHGFWTERVLHDGGRTLMLAFASVTFLGWLGSLRLARWQVARRPLAYLLVATLLSVGAANLGKQLTNVDCPWDLVDYGGELRYYGLFNDKPADEPRGRCFPGGHSSAGFALFGLYFVARHARRSRPSLMLLPPLLIGGTFAVDQWVRGAHFPSHDLTTAYLCWMIALGCHAWLFGEREPAARQATK